MPANQDNTILVAMSGGVDSSVVAAMLRDEGSDIIGLFMRNGITADPNVGKPNKQGCCSLGDSQDARFVASQLGARFYVLNFADDFSQVIKYFVDEYKSGRTPNPCAVCNTDLKFGKLLDYARAVGAGKVATGHYASVKFSDDRWRLYKGKDSNKDQSYYLFGLTQEQLEHAMFPLGELTKPEVRELANKYELKTRDKPESMEICFVPEGDYRKVVKEHAPEAFRAGDILDTTGHVLGEHQGVAGFTIGQRRGLGIATGEPRYVISLDPVANTVTVGGVEDLSIKQIEVERVNWVGLESLPEGESVKATVKVRYRHAGDAATIHGHDDNSATVIFDEPIRGAAPGQCAVFYDDQECLGGGWIA
ncbi:MAG: tRNA 2-thiouridine(34) synthase MnmA [Planctomycetes bacterium]|nr:tRNA 2-thiouridine(34) synthase MnmA [Planctomycetota bacterium]